jgi:hypothetical protein
MAIDPELEFRWLVFVTIVVMVAIAVWLVFFK